MSRLHRGPLRILISEIVSDVHRPGDVLPRETSMMELFGISRGVVRECMRALEERGLVTVKHGRGAIVNPPEEWNRFDPDVLSLLLESDRRIETLREYLECRRILEVEAATIAARRATEADTAALNEAFRQMRISAQRARRNPMAEDSYHEADIAFHQAVTRATGNYALGHMTAPIHRALGARLSHARPEMRLERSIPEHERILRAIAEHKPDAAAQAMRDHLMTVERYLAEYAAGLAAAAETRSPRGRSR